MNNYTYKNKIVYLGLDVHKKTYAYTARCDRATVKKGTLPADPEALLAFLRRYFPGAEIFSAYEAGFCGFSLHRFLCQNGIKNIVVNPSSIETASRDRVKTDKKDSLKIAVQLEFGRLQGIYVPSPERERKREISRLRDDFVKKKVVISNQIKSLFLRQGIKTPEGVVSRKWILKLKDCKLEKEIQFVLVSHIESWVNIDNQIKKVEEMLKKQAALEGKDHLIIESMPGVGLITARILSNELDNMHQFKNVRQLYSYTGLTPREYSSGEHQRLGHISRQGRARLRKTLVQSAWVAIRYDHELYEVFTNLSNRIGAKKAIIAIARRLIGRVRACLIRGEVYYKKNMEYSVA